MSMSKDGINRLIQAMAEQAKEEAKEELARIEAANTPEPWKPGEDQLQWSNLPNEDIEFMTEDGNISLTDATTAANEAIERMMKQ